MKCSGTSLESIRGPGSAIFRENDQLSAFLFVETSRGRQLTKWKQRKQAKSLKFLSTFSRFKAFVHAILNCNVSLGIPGRVSRCLLSVVNGLQALLVRAGVELNPGPDEPANLPAFVTVSQNCRGLSDCKKACKLMKSIYGSKGSPTIACLQETHCLNTFALNNFFRGSSVIPKLFSTDIALEQNKNWLKEQLIASIEQIPPH